MEPVIAANAAGDDFGWALAAGDFDGDGYDDLAVGAPGNNAGIGVLLLYRGTPAGPRFWRTIRQSDVGAPSQPLAEEPDDRFGHALAVGDFNDDGVADLAVGIPREDVGSVVDAGYVAVIPGCSSGTLCSTGESGLQPGWAHGFDQSSLGANETWDNFGYALAAGDYDGDRKDDLAVGLPYEEAFSNPQNSGFVMFYRGVSAGLGQTTRVVAHTGISQSLHSSPEALDKFGFSLAFVNINGSGAMELAIGAPGEDSNRGTVHVAAWNGSAWSLSHDFGGGAIAGGQLGTTLAAGNFRGGTEEDIAMGAPYSSDGGRVYTVQGNATGIPTGFAYVQSPFTSSGDKFGASLAVFDAKSTSTSHRDLLVGSPGGNVYSAADGHIDYFAGGSTGISWTNFVHQYIGRYSGENVCPTANENLVCDPAQWPAKVAAPFEAAPFAQADEQLGFSLVAGQFNGASGPKSDIIGGAPTDRIDGLTSGSVYVYSEGTTQREARLDQATVIYSTESQY